MEARMLVSFAYWQRPEILISMLDDVVASGLELDLFLDSGAFTASNKQIDLTTAKYAEWVKRMQPYMRHFSNLDVIGNAEATWRNQLELEDRLGISPVPVYHAATKFSYLDRLLSKGYKYIALGGMANRMKRPPIQWMIKCFQLAAEEGAQYHGFGVSDAKIIKSFPWQSVDSSGWLAGERFAAVSLFDSRRGEFKRVKLEPQTVQQLYRGSAQARRVGVKLKEVAAVKPGTLMDRDQRLAMALINIESCTQMEAFTRRLHRDRELRLYFAICTIAQFSQVATAYRGMLASSERRRGRATTSRPA